MTRPNGDRAPLASRRTATAIKSATQTWNLNADETVVIAVESPFPQQYEIGDKITVFGRDYTLNRLPPVKKTGMHEFQYTLTFEGIQYDLLRVQYELSIETSGNQLQDVQGDSLTGTLRKFMEVLIANANRVFPGQWSLGECPETEYKTLTFDGENCLAVMQNLCNEFTEGSTTVEFDINKVDGVYVVDMKKVGSVLPYTFQFGRGGGMYELTRQNVTSSDIVTRLFVFGSSENISLKYRADRLCLPGCTKHQSFIQDNALVAKYGIIEGRKVFDKVKPHYDGEVTSVVAGNVLQFVDSGFPFDLMAKNGDETIYLVPGENAKIHFNTGNLAGYEFEVTNYEHATHKFTLKKFQDDRGDVFPNETSEAFQFHGRNGSVPGDKYKILGIIYPDSITNAAESELQEESALYYPQVSQPKVQYALSLEKNFLKKLVGGNVSNAIVNAFVPGDYLHIIDHDIDVDKSIRIKGFTRDILDEYKYTLTISDTVTTSTTTRVLQELAEIDKIIQINNLKDPARARANWRTSREVLDMVFDPDGDYYTDRIKPLSIDTSMLSVGAKSMQFGLTNTVIQPNFNGNANMVSWKGGVLTHYTINEDSAVSWVIADGSITFNDNNARYLYAKCERNGTAGTFLWSNQQIKVEDDANYYHFLIGTLSSVDTELQVRSLALTYGFTTINGRFIKTGRIESADGNTYFDLDNGEIGGRIVFTRNGEGMTLAELGAESANAQSFINSTLPGLLTAMNNQIDGKIETWYTSSDPSTAWTTNDERAKHVGDLWFNTTTNEAKRYNSTYAWELIRDKDAIQALADAATAQDTADGKRRVFVDTPYPPYDIGDLWAQGATGELMRCGTSRQTGAFVSTDWVKATKYTGDENLNDFIQNTFQNAMTQINTKIDGKVETWFTNTDPAAAWTTNDERAKHVGDLWFNTTTNEAKRYKYESSTYSWELLQDKDAIKALADAANAQDTADGKRRVFTSTPYPPYDVGDLWAQGATGELMRCVNSRQTGNYVASDWDKASKYTGDENLNDFIQNTYDVAIADIYHQLDGVIETHFGNGVPTLNNAPAVDWNTTALREEHLGDMYYDNDSGIGYRFSKENGTYRWVEVRDTGVADALAAAARAQDTADGKRRVFTSTPYPPYDVGDLWASGTFLKRCITARTSGTYNAADWDLATNYTGDENLNAFINGVFYDSISDIYDQLDGKLESWYTSSDPSTNWDAAEKAKHIGDQWFNTSTNRLYRYAFSGGTYSWAEITNQIAIDAASAAARAQDTADGKRRVFVAQPTPPYDIGDLWTQGTSGDLMRCKTARATGNYVASDWVKATKYTGDENLNAFIDGVFADSIADIYDQLDGKVEMWYTSSDPNNDWDTFDKKAEHVGDMWYNTSSHRLYRFMYTRLNAFFWEEITNQDALDAAAAASQAQDTADGKRRVFTSTPYPPYDVGDLWAQGATGDLKVCKTAKSASQTYSSSDWVKATKYTDNTAFNNFVNNVYNVQVTAFSTQLDGKIETWFQSSDPSTQWLTLSDATKHIGDLWFNTTSQRLYRWENTDSDNFAWQEITNKDALDAMAAASQAQDTADGKRRVFVAQPTTPYDIGDLWVDGRDLRRCVTAKTSGQSYNVNDWVVAVYYDNTKTTIDGGLVTSGTIQVAGDNQSILAGMTGNGTTAESIRFWAGASFENRATAPFRVRQDGGVVMTKADITGKINATSGTIGGFEIASGRIGSAYSRTTQEGLSLRNGMISFRYKDSDREHWAAIGGDAGWIVVDNMADFEMKSDSPYGLNGSALVVKCKAGNRSYDYYYQQRAIDYDGNIFGVGKRAQFELGYIGQAWTNIITKYFGVTHMYHFTTCASSILEIDLPTKSTVDSMVSNEVVMFDIEIVCDRDMPNKIRIMSSNGAQIYNNNGGAQSYIDMAKGDILVLRYYNGGYMIIQQRN